MSFCKSITGVALIVKKENKILLYKRNIPEKIAYGYYALPGGTVEDNETVIQAACREAAEEIGIHIDVNDIKIAHIIRLREKYDAATNTTNQILFLYCAEVSRWHGEPKNLEPDKHSDLGWFDIDQLPEKLFPLNKKALASMGNQEFYAEYGWE